MYPGGRCAVQPMGIRPLNPGLGALAMVPFLWNKFLFAAEQRFEPEGPWAWLVEVLYACKGVRLSTGSRS